MIDFIKKQDNYFIEGLTKKGSHIYFVEIPENKLNFHIQHPSTNNSVKAPTQLVIYSNITISDKMLQELNQSCIIKVIELCNRNQQIVAYPLTGFNYNKLKKLLFEFTEKFSL